ncbi:MAG: LLM class flavin-dependent oxidoreductase [Thermoleophilia bacterium]|nr:LLM class flavin-dependent oxidoreductase [Thermoleophilia bacterium]
MRFGAFLAPFHDPRENPTLSLERDLDLIVLMDRLGFDEAWVGEHHTTGWEYIASPEIFLAVAAERTRHIRLGTGAVSLTYHHPLMVADRIVLLDHLTRGRVNLGVGPGGHLSDAAMLGVPAAEIRDRMEHNLQVILHLLTSTEPITASGPGWELHDAVLQLRPYQRPHPPLGIPSLESPFGMALAGRVGAAPLSLFFGAADLAAQWAITEQAARDAGRTASRDGWRVVVPVHLAETRAQAVEEVRTGGGEWMFEYVQALTGRPAPVPGPKGQAVDQMIEAGSWVIGTPDDLVEFIRGLEERTGGFGTFLCWGHEWAGPDATRRSYELLARFVMPEMQGSLDGLRASGDIARAKAADLHGQRVAGVEEARRRHEDGTPTG